MQRQAWNICQGCRHKSHAGTNSFGKGATGVIGVKRGLDAQLVVNGGALPGAPFFSVLLFVPLSFVYHPSDHS